MGIKLIKKTQEKINKLPTEQKDLVYVPGFTKADELAELVNDIHNQFKELGPEESGWDGDAMVCTKLSDAMKAPGLTYLLAVGDSDTVFAFASKYDRDCMIMDYLPDPEMW